MHASLSCIHLPVLASSIMDLSLCGYLSTTRIFAHYRTNPLTGSGESRQSYTKAAEAKHSSHHGGQMMLSRGMDG
ncbi:uncharacterized protein BP01DRAFT_355521 [Aspergillus saccharolyticus JOP 1030-1]|uniref:Secreted protein n=1 Tax=Aspergillus saccharolyticus JOP 1030-1 TaxID=1450539 RepID=A0A318ZIB0_9EURO|nr:hypothetical protein BP01DRAFT_355521 [Aspergillus saccharolyticus JOP 1030-1]PYH46507.1 hypothetical protein BP01DRAFT_355521 [Aspergillus saccharolyticus JOP 1030-1]